MLERERLHQATSSKDKKACGQAAHTARHVAGRSRPFDRPHRRPRSGEARSFYEKPLMFLGNQPALQRPSQNILQITPQIIFKSTRSPERMSSGFFCKKTLPFIKNQPALQRHSQRFFRKPPQIFLKSKYRPPLIISFFFQKIRVASGPRAWARPKN